MAANQIEASVRIAPEKKMRQQAAKVRVSSNVGGQARVEVVLS